MKYLRLIAFLLCLALLGGCALEISTPAEGTITFTDDLGRSVALPQKPRRVAALIGSFAEVWILSGGTLCAAPEDAWDDFGLELPDAVSIGGAHSPNPEMLLSADPDFVLASASTASNVQLREILEAAGIAVAYFDVDHFEDYLRILEICTDITGRKDLYEQNGLQVLERIEAVRRQFGDHPLPQEERTVLLLRASSGFVKAKGSQGTILGEMLAELGCINIADSDTFLLEDLSVESVIRQEPCHIFVVTMGDDTEKAMDSLKQLMAENPAWGSLGAVTGGRVHLMERRLFNMKPNAKWAESYEILSDILLGT